MPTHIWHNFTQYDREEGTVVGPLQWMHHHLWYTVDLVHNIDGCYYYYYYFYYYFY